ncbi:MAG: (4Fe-4S)-binding protein [Bacteroidetes bacterium]|nr:MAG: (4Fe-4S)-binding protein [Bacteroidota bacterium]
MKEIVVLSGKGGTGKTSITASFAALGASQMVLADCDVDAADMHLLTAPEVLETEDFYSGKEAFIKTEGCIHCYKCIKACHYDAISVINGDFIVDPMECEGCSYCFHVCPTHTIEMNARLAGKFHISKTRFGNTLVHARLGIAADNSGKLVTKVRDEAKRIATEQQSDYILVDASPGIGCPVVASLTGAHYVVLVTEPTVSGIHDLGRVYELIEKLKIKTGCIINKADINTDMAEKTKLFLKEKGIPLIAELPYDIQFTKAITLGKTVVEYDDGSIRDLLTECWEKVKALVDAI